MHQAAAHLASREALRGILQKWKAFIGRRMGARKLLPKKRILPEGAAC